MSELNWYWVYVPYLDAPNRQQDSAVRAGYNKVVFKSEADKEINLWKNEAHKHYENWFNLNKQYEGWFGKVMRCERAERELRRQKYKRCLAMVEMCRAKYDEEDAKVNGRGASWDYISDEMKYWERWHNRWLELAEKFNDKETK